MSTATIGEGVLNWHTDGLVLSREQKEFYEINGYLIVRNVVPKYELDRYRRRFQEICENKEQIPMLQIVRDITIVKSEFVPGEKAVTKINDFHHDPVLFDYCKNPTIVEMVKDLIGNKNSNLMAMNTMLINKPPDNGKLTSRHPMHQDLQYFTFRPADFICCAWTAMERVNRANGCLVVVPGTHKGTLLAHKYPEWEGGVNVGYFGIQNYDPSMPRTHVEMEAGDTVFFHPLLIHGSGTNRTEGFRKAISCHYANDDLCRYVDCSKEGNQAETTKELMRVAKDLLARKFGTTDVEIHYEDIWRLKGREVNGVRSNL